MKRKNGPRGFRVKVLGEDTEIPRDSNKLWLTLFYSLPKELAEKWHKEAETSQIIASMSEKEVEAITKLFGGVLKEDGKKSNRRSGWWNLFFCLLGIVGGYLVSKFLL